MGIECPVFGYRMPLCLGIECPCVWVWYALISFVRCAFRGQLPRSARGSGMVGGPDSRSGPLRHLLLRIALGGGLSPTGQTGTGALARGASRSGQRSGRLAGLPDLCPRLSGTEAAAAFNQARAQQLWEMAFLSVQTRVSYESPTGLDLACCSHGANDRVRDG